MELCGMAVPTEATLFVAGVILMRLLCLSCYVDGTLL
jgi:hypothetical protein